MYSYYEKKNPGYYLYIAVANTNKTIIDWLYIRWEGNISFKKSKINNHKDYWVWQIDGRKAFRFLKEIYPYLIIKKPQAQIGIEFQTKKKSQKGQKKFDPNEITRRENWRNELMKLNKRGVETYA